MPIIRQNFGALGDSPAEAMIAPVLYSDISGATWPVGSQFILGGVLYTVTVEIGSGEQIIPGTNCINSDNLVEQLAGLDADLSNDILTLRNKINKFVYPSNYIRIAKTYTQYDVVIYHNGNIILPQNFTVVAGTYTPSIVYSGVRYVNLGSVSDADVKKAFPRATSTPGTRITIGYVVIYDGTSGPMTSSGIFLFCGGSGGGTAGYWYLTTNALQNSTGAGITLSSNKNFIAIPTVNTYGYTDINDIPLT